MAQPKTILVRNIMTRDVLAVTVATPLIDAFHMMLKAGFNGLPVVDEDKKVVGIVTDYDLITKTTAIHIPTYIKIFGEPVFDENQSVPDEKDGDGVITVNSVMNREPLTLFADATLAEAVKAFSEHHRVNPIPVVDNSGKLVGVVSRFDVIKFYAGVLKGFVQNFKREGV